MGPVNLGNTNEITILELAEKIINHTGSKSKIIFKDLPIDDPIQRKPVTQKRQMSLIGYQKLILMRG